MKNFRDLFERLSPTWLLQFWGIRLVGSSVSLIADILVEGAAQAIKAHLLRQPSSPVDALPLVGLDRDMVRYRADTDASYRQRLLDAWDIYEHAGNERAIELNLRAYGLVNFYFPTVLKGWPFENPPVPANWSRFGIVILQPHPWTPASPITAAELETIVRIARKWKSGHEQIVQVVVVYSEPYYDQPGLQYDDGSVYSGSTAVYSV